MFDNHLLNNNDNVIYGVVVNIYDLNSEDRFIVSCPFPCTLDVYMYARMSVFSFAFICNFNIKYYFLNKIHSFSDVNSTVGIVLTIPYILVYTSNVNF